MHGTLVARKTKPGYGGPPRINVVFDSFLTFGVLRLGDRRRLDTSLVLTVNYEYSGNCDYDKKYSSSI